MKFMIQIFKLSLLIVLLFLCFRVRALEVQLLQVQKNQVAFSQYQLDIDKQLLSVIEPAKE